MKDLDNLSQDTDLEWFLKSQKILNTVIGFNISLPQNYTPNRTQNSKQI